VNRFAELLDGLVYTSSRNDKVKRLIEYFDTTPDPDRGWALAAMCSVVDLPGAKPGIVRGMIANRVDPELFRLSYDYVGDLAETVSLIWPETIGKNHATLSLNDIVTELRAADRNKVKLLLARWLNTLDAKGRWALLKFLMGGLRIGVSGRLARISLSEWSGVAVEQIEEIWHGVEPPYTDLFAWLNGNSPKPDIEGKAVYRPLMLAHPIEFKDLTDLDPRDYIAEWKWDGIRVQLASRNGTVRLFSRTGDDIGKVFPDIVEGVNFDGVIDGELLVYDKDSFRQAFEPAPFNDLQQRLNRKTVSSKILAEYPAFIRAYDILYDKTEDLRSLPMSKRRERLEEWYQSKTPTFADLSPIISFSNWSELETLRSSARGKAREGLMIKRRNSAYEPGRRRGLWFKWKRNAMLLDCVLMYAQRGHGRRSSYFSDYTFGVWREDGLVPIGKAYSGFTDEELQGLDKWVRGHTTERFGPVRAVEQGVVFEVAFDSLHASKRHKSGLAMRFPRIHRIRWDKSPADADTLQAAESLMET